MALLIFVLGPAASTAQTVEEYRPRVQRLAEQLSVLRAARESADSADRAAIEIDTIRAGLLTVLCSSVHSRIIRAGLRSAWDSIRTVLGTDTAILTGTTLFLESHSDQGPRLAQPKAGVRSIGFWPEYAADIPAQIISAAEQSVLAKIEGLSSWFGGRLNWFADDDEFLEPAYLELATSPFTVVRECYLGNLTSCAHALGLTQPSDTLDAWYDPDDQRMVVERLWRGWTRLPEGTQSCLDGLDTEMCRSLILRRWREVPPPLSANARMTMAHVALESGGAGVYGRLIAPTAIHMGDRLASVAELAPDSLTNAWRSAVLAARPTPAKVPRRLGWTTFFWVFAFLAAASRSSRWR